MTNPPYSEGKNPADQIVITYVSNSMDTTVSDPFRQGVELTQAKHFQQGIAKIWSGIPNHKVDLNRYGQMDDQIAPDKAYFDDVSKFEPVLHLTDYYDNQPIIIDSAISVNEKGLDGIIEPLSIRRVVTFTSINIPFEPHSVKGSLESGNHDPFRHADQIVSSYKFSEYSIGDHWYEDNVDMTGDLPTNVGFWPTITTRLLGFDDSQLKDGVIVPENADETFIETLKVMAPSTNNHLPKDHVSLAALLHDIRDYRY